MKKLTDILNKIAKGREDPDVDTPEGACITLRFNYEDCDWDIVSCRDVGSQDPCDEGLNGQLFTIYKNCKCDKILPRISSTNNDCSIWRLEIPDGPEGEEGDGLCCVIITSPNGSTYKVCRGWATQCSCEKYNEDPILNRLGRVQASFHKDRPGLEDCSDIDCVDTTGACCREWRNGGVGGCRCKEDNASNCLLDKFRLWPGTWYPNKDCDSVNRNGDCCYPMA